ncbi:transcriptional regulator, TetR family [Streptomyces zhaozhouensis]|uniref:Transcriptional regulator, TetR family n=1 Tax=Streptomyces zhaozhouensis TaxID=1300267 RepID=A0A286E2T8_9ACTN|nr:TetR family transcriptional regulator [Streptomyces zhaozhouensis]SOD65216.1 transcriptional regulator, TetR family [Streptomyces zhaozhouensis]
MSDADTSGGAPTLRERKKLRTRRALVSEALRRFTERGFAETTLDEVVEAVEVSQRTFFRNFASKEAVALAPEQELWAAYTAAFAELPPGGTAQSDYREALFAAVLAMDEDWAARFRACRALAERTPALAGHSLRDCAETTDRVLELAAARHPVARPEDGVRQRLLLELMLSAWRWAVHDWLLADAPGSAPGAGADGDAGTGDGADGRAELVARTRRALTLLPEVAALAADA